MLYATDSQTNKSIGKDCLDHLFIYWCVLSNALGNVNQAPLVCTSLKRTTLRETFFLPRRLNGINHLNDVLTVLYYLLFILT
jgi:hypothetical protein